MKVDLVPLLEMVLNERKKGETREIRRSREDKMDKKIPNVFELLEERRRENVLIEKFASDLVKINKPEEKKDDKKWHDNTTQLAIILLASFPVLAPIYVAWLGKMLH